MEESIRILAAIPMNSGATRRPGIRFQAGSQTFRITYSPYRAVIEIHGAVGADGRRLYATVAHNGAVAMDPKNGDFYPRTMLEFTAAVESFVNHPHEFVNDQSLRLRCCCFCSTPLTLKASREYGYGPDCAQRYCLPYSRKS